MFKSDLSPERQLFAFTYRDLVPETADVWLYIDLFDTLDLEDFYLDYSTQGEEAVDPRLMLRSVFYGLTHGIASGRKLANACEFDNRYVVMSGARRPDRRTFDRFLRRHEPRMTDLFAQVVRLASVMGLVSLGRLAIDGTRLKAHTSRGRTMKYGKMDKAIETIKRELSELRSNTERENAVEEDLETNLPEEIKRREARLESIQRAKAQIEREAGAEPPKPTAQKSFNDLDSVSMGIGKKDGFIMGYNGQIAVDEQSQIVVAAEVFAKATDTKLLSPMLESLGNLCTKTPEKILVDAGYHSAENIRAIEATGAIPIMSLRPDQHAKGENEARESKYEQLKPGSMSGEYYCMAEKLLPVVYRSGGGKTFVQFNEDFCADCPFQTTCHYFKKRGKKIQLAPEADRQTHAAIHQRSRTADYQEDYKYRKGIVEPVFGNVKWNKGLKINISGLKHVSAWWKMVMTAHNIEKIVRNMALTPA